MNLPLDGIINAAERANHAKPGDYIDPKTGLLMCGVCHTPKQKRVTFIDKQVVVHVSCKHMQDLYNERWDDMHEMERADNIKRRRSICFGHGRLKQTYTFDADDGADPVTMRLAKGYVEDFQDMYKRGKGLLFLGPSGTGKTFAACCIANALLDKNYKVKVTTFAEIAANLQSTYDKDDVYDGLCWYDLLIIDDLGAERTSSYMDEIIFTVVDTRLSCGKPMIVTSNLSAEAFSGGAEIEQQRVYSRLYEACLPVVVYGKDRRKEKMANETDADYAQLMQAGGEENGNV